jgi:ribose 1,5-bisphosphate isomerase
MTMFPDDGAANPLADPVIAERIASIGADQEHGATDLARQALDTLALAAQRLPEEGLAASLDGIGILLVFAKPTMAAVKNAVSRALADGPHHHPGHATRAVDRARAWLDFAASGTAEQAGAVITDGAVLATCSYSASVVHACAAAARDGKRPWVLVLPSVVDGVAHGERMAAALREAGVRADLVPEGDPLPQGLTAALVGADRVLPDGSLVNGTPTLALAEAMREAGTPLYVVCETFKLDDAAHVEPGFDHVPAALVSAYITERGVAEPAEVWALKG